MPDRCPRDERAQLEPAMEFLLAVLAVVARVLLALIACSSSNRQVATKRKGKIRRTSSMEIMLPGGYGLKRSSSETSEWDDSDNNS